MKELSLEQKAKAYDKAIERAKSKLHYPDRPCFVNVIEIFPELKESGDEKIRKELLSFFTERAKYTEDSTFNGLSSKEIIAWLEKQGEQKPTDKVEPKFKVGDKIYLKPEYRMPDDDTPISNTVKEIIMIDDKHYRFDGSYIFIEDQDKYELVEQMPAWSEEDKNRFNNLIFLVEHSDENEATKEGFIKFINKLKSLRPQNRWKPSESQLEALKIACDEHWELDGWDPLYTLCQDLKKLKE